MQIPITSLLLAMFVSAAHAGGTTEFCLDGEFNLGARMQGHALSNEWVPTTWCVVTDDDSNRVLYSATGKSNSDMDGDWAVAYLPPDMVRIVNRESPPDIEFNGTDNLDEALRVRRIDPRRFAKEMSDNLDWLIPRASQRTLQLLDSNLPDAVQLPGVEGPVFLKMENGRIEFVEVFATLPLFGELNLTWRWDWSDEEHPVLTVSSPRNRVTFFEATGSWRDIPDDEAAQLWTATPGADPIPVPGDRWPARVNMQLVNLAKDVYLVRGVRSGFQHMVIDTDDGLVVADAPASWLELHQLPPANLVQGLGLDELSENFVKFLGTEFAGRPIRAVALTHFHDDHSGGAAAFAAAGADVYAPAKTSEILTAAFRERVIPDDDSGDEQAPFEILPVANAVTIGDESNRVRFMQLGENPHVFEMLGVWAVDRDYFFVSDVHVPGSDAEEPSEDRAATECWFARWAVDNLPPDVRVINSHSAPETPVSRLAKYLESEACL